MSNLDRLNEVLIKMSVFTTGNEVIESNPKFAMEQARKELVPIIKAFQDEREREVLKALLNQGESITQRFAHKYIYAVRDTVIEARLSALEGRK